MGASDRPPPGHHQRAGVAEAADAGEVTGETGERGSERHSERLFTNIEKVVSHAHTTHTRIVASGSSTFTPLP